MPRIIKFVSMRDDPVVISSKSLVWQTPIPVEPLPDELCVENMLVDADKKAAQIIAAAQVAADHCLEEAMQQAEVIKQQAQQQGHQQGYEEGILQGKETALQQMVQNLEESVRKGEHVLSTAEQAAQAMIVNAERDIIDIAMAVTRKILAREIDENPVVVLPIVKTALEKVRDQDRVIIRVNPADFDIVLQAKNDLQMMVDREQAITITADHAVEQGGCMIETANGTVDARITTQMEALKKALQEVLP